MHGSSNSHGYPNVVKLFEVDAIKLRVITETSERPKNATFIVRDGFYFHVGYARIISLILRMCVINCNVHAFGPGNGYLGVQIRKVFKGGNC